MSGDVDQAGGITSLDYSSSNQDLVSGMASLRERLLGSKNFMGFVNNQDFAKPNDFTDLMALHPISVDLIDENLTRIVKNYLGKYVKLDSAVLSVMNMSGSDGNFQNQSGMLHHDSVGHRLKFFFPINMLGNADYPTVYLDDSHKIRWESFLNPENGHGVRISENIVQMYSHKEKSETNVPFGSGYLFDTNGMHAGCYRAASEPRMIITFEFSALKSIFPGKIGSSHFTMSKYAYDTLKNLNLIRSERVTQGSDGVYIHNGRNRRNEALNICDLL
ncbi:hypothetical protein N9Y23_02615 [Pseudomonadales bacterium]|nr:hypothetical protein [Pseudomonadales bacterium]